MIFVQYWIKNEGETLERKGLARKGKTVSQIQKNSYQNPAGSFVPEESIDGSICPLSPAT